MHVRAFLASQDPPQNAKLGSPVSRGPLTPLRWRRFFPIPLFVGQDGILRPIGNRPVVDLSNASAGRLTIGRRLPTRPTFAAQPHCVPRIPSAGYNLD